MSGGWVGGGGGVAVSAGWESSRMKFYNCGENRRNLANLSWALATAGMQKQIMRLGDLVRSFQRQKYPNGCSVAFRIDLTSDADFTSMAFNKLLCNEQSDSCADRIAGSEKGFKYSWQMVRRDAHSIVGNRQLHSAGGLIDIFDGYR